MLKRLAAMSVEAARRYGGYLFFQQTYKQIKSYGATHSAADLRDYYKDFVPSVRFVFV